MNVRGNGELSELVDRLLRDHFLGRKMKDEIERDLHLARAEVERLSRQLESAAAVHQPVDRLLEVLKERLQARRAEGGLRSPKALKFFLDAIPFVKQLPEEKVRGIVVDLFGPEFEVAA